MKKVKICTVVKGRTVKEFLANLQVIQKESSFLELRLDSIAGLKLYDIDVILTAASRPVIVTCRRNTASGKGGFTGSIRDEKIILERADELGADFIDTEVQYFAGMEFRPEQAKLILSFHDFERTPGLQELEEIKEQMQAAGAVICKFATMVTTEKDIDILGRFLAKKEKREELIVLGMGETASEFRLLSPILGGFCTFASFKKETSAPGQIDLPEMKKYYNSLNIIY
jgi:3-dehydroquinate dehydratase type I